MFTYGSSPALIIQQIKQITNAAVNVFPNPPNRGVTTRVTWGFAVCSSPLGLGVFSSFVPRLESRDLSILIIILTIQVTAIK